jgi:hypothetical protein
MTDTILHDTQLSNSAYSHVINAPIEKVDIADWLFNCRRLSISAVVHQTTFPAAQPHG